MNTRHPNKRFKVLEPSQEIETLSDESPDDFCTNILDYYYDRPKSHDDYSCYRFASWCSKCTAPTNNIVKYACNESIYCQQQDD